MTLSKKPLPKQESATNGPDLPSTYRETRKDSAPARDREQDQMIEMAKECDREGRLQDALGWYRKAQSLGHRPWVADRIKEIERRMEEETAYKKLRQALLRLPAAQAAEECREFLKRYGDSPFADAVRTELDGLVARLEEERRRPDTRPKEVSKQTIEDEVTSLLSQLALNLPDATRASLSQQFLLARTRCPAKGELVGFAWLLTSRTEKAWGLSVDRVRAASREFTGSLELNAEKLIVLRAMDGQKIQLEKTPGNCWKVTIGTKTAGEMSDVTVEKDVATASATALSGNFSRLPPSSWMKAKPAQHLEETGKLAGALKTAAVSASTAVVLIRVLAASHALAALVPEPEAAKAHLKGLGFAEVKAGRWELTSENTLLTLGKILLSRQERTREEILKIVSVYRDDKDFRLRYAAMAVRLWGPLDKKEDVQDILKSIESASKAVRSDAEAAHVNALLDAARAFMPCSNCKGVGDLPCPKCKGKGRLIASCNPCNGHGFRFQPGPGNVVCGDCGGRGTWRENCDQCCQGRVDCPACETPFALPQLRQICSNKSCPMCSGSGEVGVSLVIACPRCLGLGVLIIPEGAPKAVLP
ncbi:MAG: hypothetical protein HYY17_15540 [Planctomycetes bacterium]|nr:hypothetical protein [Planctomycetota bacterium]